MVLTKLPRRSSTVKTVSTTNTAKSDDDPALEADMSNSSKVLYNRLQAWKHVCGYLENYITATHKAHESQSKEFGKILKALPEPLEDASHFSEGKGGVVGLFDNLRTNTGAIVDLHRDTEKNLENLVLPILKQLHQEIKSKAEGVEHGAEKCAKQVRKATAATHKHIEMLGKYTAAFDVGGKLEPAHDPYILRRGTSHRMNRQVAEENNYREEMLQVQNSLSLFESHIVKTMQAALLQFSNCMGAHSGSVGKLYANMVDTAQQIPDNFEWMNFSVRNEEILINPDKPARTISDAIFPNQTHSATKALIEGTLERKSRAMIKGYSPGYYAISPAGYLHGFKDNDDYNREPTADISLYIPECSIGSGDGVKFTIKGKDVSGGKVGQAFSTTTELTFKAHSKEIAEDWLDVLTKLANRSGPGSGSGAVSQTTSPAVSRTTSGAHGIPPPVAQPAAETTEIPPAPTAATSQQEEGTIAPLVDAGRP
ncbi:PH domain-containing protein [Blastomyces gilchristii SLH14081]|uniref:PH domain-containing protein n=2 Tax=Blastomyces TaxID=229219 RepID=A0A179UPR0_BLAGS|nr:PH domain-containing protein [Blastomyces gilchristii SLH14081]EGE85622.1 PH domain-containing protein [Blastomyces dermatitidis ATCC 18188]OAT08382.1 PH domain-containing protein [Blastomyces gilchristii SLH14081]